jgi:H+/Cl- antiporter ClcA/predicted transcriptional regulator
MIDHEAERASTTEGLPVAPSMGPAMAVADVPSQLALVDERVVLLCVICVALAVVAAFVAEGLVHLIALFTNLSFYGRFSFRRAWPANNQLGLLVLLVPPLGGVIVGLMARYGSKAIRGHGIPEAMEQVLTNRSRIPARMTFLKPLSAAIAIGTGGPFGAEGPIIATGGAMGSVIGQAVRTTAVERKTLLAAGAAAGMAATFGAPAAAVLLAVELLLFEFRPRSMIPVALASAAAAGVRVAFHGTHPMFPMPDLAELSGSAVACYILIGALVGVASVGVTKSVYWIEDLFELLPVHWMWWPAIGALAVGLIGYFAPQTLGVGYDNITGIISNNMGTLRFVAFLCVMKFVSWAIYLGSGTSGGTLAPLFTIGSGAGLLLGAAGERLWPGAGIDLRVAALVGMAAMFAGASRALLTSAVFAFETTLQPLGLLPLLGGCTAAYLASALLMRHTIMTEKIARRGVRVPVEYGPDFLAGVPVTEASSRTLVSLRADDSVEQVRSWIATRGSGTSHQGFPVLDDAGHLVGVLTRRDLLDPDHPGSRRLRELIRRPPVIVYDDRTLRDAADHMVNHDIGRLPVVSRSTRRVIAMLTRSDILTAHRGRLHELQHAEQGFGRPAAGTILNTAGREEDREPARTGAA